MTGSGGAMIAIPLAEGGELRVAGDGVTLGDRRFELARIQDALQVSPEPETIALRVAGAGMVEFRPLRQGDGRVALEAIYRLRPDLRPAGFEPVALPPGFPAPGQAPTSPYPDVPPFPTPGGYAPPPYSPPPYGPPAPSRYAPPPYPPRPAYGPNPNANDGRVTPYPRRFFELIGAVFQLFVRRLPRWLALGLLAGALPGAIGAGIQLALLDLQGPGAFNGLPSGTVGAQALPSSCRFTYHTPPMATLARDGAIIVGLSLLGAILAAIGTGAFAAGARDALLGRRIRLGASLRNGARRLPATLGASLLTFALYALALGPALVCFELALINLSGADLCDTSAPLPPGAVAGLLFNVAGLALIVPGVIVFLVLLVRLGPAPYVAATEPVGAGRAIARSWRLTRGSFWRTLGVVLIVQFLATLVAAPFGQFDTLPASVALPAVASIVTAPLLAIAWTTILFDLRVRREGYATLEREGEKPEVAARQTSQLPL